MDKRKKNGSLISLYKDLVEDNVPEAEYEKYIYRYLDSKARVKGIPISGSFELTPLCNLDCKMCYVHLNNSQFRNTQLLSINTWKKIIDQAYEAGMLKASLTGGECLTYPGFDEIYLYLYSLGIRPAVLSNGVLIDSKRIDFFKQNPPRRIQITLYGGSEKAYETVTGSKVFNIVYQNLIMMRDAKLPIAISITPSAFMKHDMRSLIETAESLSIPYFINSALKPPRENTGRTKQDLTTEEYIELYKIKNEISKTPIEDVDIFELPDENHTDKKIYGLRCGAGRSGFSITYDGSMCPCFSMYDIKVQPLEIGFQAAWKQLNSIVNKYPIPAECVECIYHRVCLICPAMHANASVIGHCDTRICERTKKMIRAGIITMPK